MPFKRGDIVRRKGYVRLARVRRVLGGGDIQLVMLNKALQGHDLWPASELELYNLVTGGN